MKRKLSLCNNTLSSKIVKQVSHINDVKLWAKIRNNIQNVSLVYGLQKSYVTI